MQTLQNDRINPPVNCAKCGSPTYIIGDDEKPECCACMEKRILESNPNVDNPRFNFCV